MLWFSLIMSRLNSNITFLEYKFILEKPKFLKFVDLSIKVQIIKQNLYLFFKKIRST